MSPDAHLTERTSEGQSPAVGPTWTSRKMHPLSVKRPEGPRTASSTTMTSARKTARTLRATKKVRARPAVTTQMMRKMQSLPSYVGRWTGKGPGRPPDPQDLQQLRGAQTPEPPVSSQAQRWGDQAQDAKEEARGRNSLQDGARRRGKTPLPP
jgi:hypothetical protein